jgi:excisionase family DNA binding protein
MAREHNPATIPLNERLVVKVHEAAALVGVSRATMYIMIANGEVESIKRGGRRGVIVASLRQWVVRNTVKD